MSNGFASSASRMEVRRNSQRSFSPVSRSMRPSLRLRDRLQLGIDVDAGHVAALDRRPQGLGAASAADFEHPGRGAGPDQRDEFAALPCVPAPHIRAEMPAVAAVVVIERLLFLGREHRVRQPPGEEIVDRAGADFRQGLHRHPFRFGLSVASGRSAGNPAARRIHGAHFGCRAMKSSTARLNASGCSQ